ncbi:MAG: DUF1573 domain-containing protein [Bdellovibrionales bacterium]|nr:DUF1573 domain-containing protein [Bdellovibrionales bacterium]
MTATLRLVGLPTISVFLVLLCSVSVYAVPQLSIVGAEHSFGAVAQGDKVTHSFLLKNLGDENLEIQRVVPSCGCTVSTLEKNSLAPGEETSLNVDFDTRGMSGPKVKTVRIYTNDPEQLTALVTMKGEVQPDLIVEPQRVHFGEVLRDESEGAFVERAIKVSTRKGSSAKIKKLISRSKWVQLEKVKGDDHSYEGVLKLRKDVEVGEFRERIIIEVEGIKQRTVNLPLYASVREKIQIKPQVLSFGIIDGSRSLEKEAKIENKGSSTLRLLSATTDSSAVSVSVEETNPGKVFLLKVKLDAEQIEKDLKSAIRLKFASPEVEEEQEVLVSVTAVLPPSFLKSRKQG